MKRIVLALALVLTPAAAFAQCNGVFANGTVCGNATGSSNLPRPTPPAAFQGSAGGSNGQIQYNSSGALAGATGGDVVMSGTQTSIAVGAVTSTKLAANAISVFPSRAIAKTLDLTAYSGILVEGYANSGDGGLATFQKVAPGTTLLDTFVNCNPCTLVGGSGYTNGTYNGVPLAGGSGSTCVGQVVVSGGVVTQVNFAVPCVTHKVGDPLTTANTNIGGTGTGFTYTVTSISTPQASFTDSAGNLWQYSIFGQINVLQFGCIGDWNGVDGSATNNTNCIWSATSMASIPVGASQANVFGNRVWFPRGAYMTCGGQFLNSAYNFPIPTGVHFAGAGYGAVSLRQCASDTSGTHYIELCDSNMSVGEFSCSITDMTLDSSAIASSTSNIAVIYSSAGQQFPLAARVNILAGLKGCIKYEIGRGGAANDIWYNINCVQFDAATTPAFSFNAGSVQHMLRDSVCASSPSGGAANCVSNSGGRLIVDGLDIEGFVLGFVQNVATAGNNSVFRNVQQNSLSCTAMIQLANTNVPGNTVFENDATTCPLTIQNGQVGGSNFTGNIRGPTMCVSGACNAAVP